MAWKNKTQKLTWDEIREMRKIRSPNAGQFKRDDPRSVRSLALRFGVAVSTVSKICNNDIWLENDEKVC
jgi:hypothetical protein